MRVENANVHLGTNAGLGNIGTDIIAIGNNSAASNIVISTNFVSWDGGTGILGVTDTTGIARGYTVSGTGFTLGQTVYSVIDSGNLQMGENADGTPSGVMTFSSAQGNNSVAIGNNAGHTTQNAGSVAIGNSAGSTGQFSLAVAVGDRAGETNQGYGAVAIGGYAGNNTQGDRAVAIGNIAGGNTQGGSAVAIGYSAGNDTQGVNAVAVGRLAGSTSQGGTAVAVGNSAGLSGQGISSVAIGNRAGRLSQGGNSIAIGSQAGFTSQANNSIILNATGSTLNQTTANTFTVKPVRQANTSNVMFYNTTSGEISYDVIGNIAVINLNGNSSQVLYGNGVFAAVSGGGNGSPGGSNTELQFNNAGSFGGISTVTWNGANISLGAVANVKVTGGSNNEVMRTDGTGNLSFSSIAETLLVGTRAGPYTVPITNYTFIVTARSGNVTVYVN